MTTIVLNKIPAYTLHNTLLKSNNKLRINGHKRCLITYQGWEIHIIIDTIYNTESGIYEYLPTNFFSIPINLPDSHSNNKTSAYKYTESGCELKNTVWYIFLPLPPPVLPAEHKQKHKHMHDTQENGMGGVCGNFNRCALLYHFNNLSQVSRCCASRMHMYTSLCPGYHGTE